MKGFSDNSNNNIIHIANSGNMKLNIKHNIFTNMYLLCCLEAINTNLWMESVKYLTPDLTLLKYLYNSFIIIDSILTVHIKSCFHHTIDFSF